MLHGSILSWMWIFVLVTACQVGYDSNIPTKATITQTVTITEEKTVVSASPSISPSVYFEYKRNCLPISPDVEIDDISTGLILNEVSSTDTKGNVVLLNISNGTRTQIFSENEKINGLRISPDRNWVAYNVIKTDDPNDSGKLILRNFATNEIKELPWDDDWDLGGIQKWINDKQILISLRSSEYPPSRIALNPFLGQKIDLPSLLPNQEIESASGEYFPLPEYNSTFDYVIYPASDNGQTGYLLKTATTLETVSFIPTQTLMTFSSPAWSNSGNAYTLSIKPFDDQSSNTFELANGSTSQQATLITSLGDHIESYYIENIVWSLDDRYIAFVVNDLTDINNQVSKLMILDMTNREVLDFCVNVNYANWRGEFADVNSPIWSPNSKELIVENQYEYGKNDVILINLSTMMASIIEKNKRVLGWVSLNR